MEECGAKCYLGFMLFTVNLLSPIEYDARSFDFADVEALEIGQELCLLCKHGYDDVIFTLTPLWSGWREAWSAEEKALIEAGQPVAHREGYELAIPGGRYTLLQTIPAEDWTALRKECYQLAGTRAQGEVYVRFIKEGPLECVMQLLIPAP